MTGLPDSLAIAWWIVGSLCVLAVIGYALGAALEWIFPVFALGANWFGGMGHTPKPRLESPRSRRPIIAKNTKGPNRVLLVAKMRFCHRSPNS
jgi:hypothetical protein